MHAVIVKASSGPRYVVGCRNKVDNSKLTNGTRVSLDMTTLTIMRALPREVGIRVTRICTAHIRLGASSRQSSWACLPQPKQA